MNPRKILIGSVAIVVALIIGFIACHERIEAGYTGIYFRHYGVTGGKGVAAKPIKSGSVWYNPFTASVYQYPHHWIPINYHNITFKSKEGAQITAGTLSGIVRLEESRIPHIFDSYRSDFKDLKTGILKTKTLNALTVSAGAMPAVDLGGVRMGELLENIEYILDSTLNIEGFYFDDLALTELDFPENVKGAIDGVISQQEINKKSEAKIVMAEAEKESRRIKSEGIADSILTVAEATAEANRIISSSLTPMLLQYNEVETWNGQTPQVVGQGSGMILDLKPR
jgi:hypothetical protein